MLLLADLKTWLHKKGLTQKDRLLLILGTFDSPCSVADIRGRAGEAGFKVLKTWNPSATLGNSSGLAIRVPAGWEITEGGKQHLRNLGVSSLSPAAVQVATDLRSHALSVNDETTRAFIEEAIRCHEAALYRSAIVMSWLSAVDVLYREVVANHLSEFNACAVSVNSSWKAAKNADDLSKMKERDFLDRLAAISLIGKSAKLQLQHAIDLRNACGHPNSLKIGPNVVAGHIEMLLMNVFTKFNP